MPGWDRDSSSEDEEEFARKRAAWVSPDHPHYDHWSDDSSRPIQPSRDPGVPVYVPPGYYI